MSTLSAKEYKCFEDIKRIRPDGSEYWAARELAPVLDYAKWENFYKVIKRAMIACENSGRSTLECFPEVRKTSPMPNGGVLVKFRLPSMLLSPMLLPVRLVALRLKGQPLKLSASAAARYLCLLPRTQCYHRYDYRRRPAFYLCVEPGDRETREEDHVLRHCSALPCTHCNSSLGNVGSRK